MRKIIIVEDTIDLDRLREKKLQIQILLQEDYYKLQHNVVAGFASHTMTRRNA